MRPGGAAGALAKAAAGEPGTALSSRNGHVSPSLLRWPYKTSGYADQNVPGAAGYLNDHPSLDDLRLFMNEYRTDGSPQPLLLYRSEVEGTS